MTNDYTSFRLYEHNTPVANMITEESFSFSTNGTVHHFQIIAQRQSTNHTSEPTQSYALPLIIGIIFVVIICITAVFIVLIKKHK
jgi:hypothetical protein